MGAVNVEIVSIGSELCYGKVADTNAFWLADQVTRLGGTVERITCVRDHEDQICTVLEESLGRKPSFVLVTGGLGPTNDDKTIDAISRITQAVIVKDEKTLERASQRRGIPKEKLPPHFTKMARTLHGGKTFSNPVGISPATALTIGKTTLVVMPGPPKEVQAIFAESILHLMRKKAIRRSRSQRVFVEMAESEVTPFIERIERELGNVYLKPLVSEYVTGTGLPIEILAFEESEEGCEQLIGEIISRLESSVTSKGRRLSLLAADIRKTTE